MKQEVPRKIGGVQKGKREGAKAGKGRGGGEDRAAAPHRCCPLAEQSPQRGGGKRAYQRDAVRLRKANALAFEHLLLRVEPHALLEQHVPQRMQVIPPTCAAAPMPPTHGAAHPHIQVHGFDRNEQLCGREKHHRSVVPQLPCLPRTACPAKHQPHTGLQGFRFRLKGQGNVRQLRKGGS